MRFAVDKMLGKLAKYLRIFGYDAYYSNRVYGYALVSMAKREDRIILTRDAKFIRRKTNARILLMESEKLEEQVEQLRRDVGVSPVFLPFSRCVECNVPIVQVEKFSVKDRVPEYVFATQEEFGECGSCGRIFWRGTHWEKMKRSTALF